MFTTEQAAELERRIAIGNGTVVRDVKIWVMSAVVVNILALVPMTFYVGSIYAKMETNFSAQVEAQAQLDWRSKWMTGNDMWRENIQDHLAKEGYKPLSREVSKLGRHERPNKP